MDSERFDRWAKLLALRMSRRSAATALGAATVASLAVPQWTLGQDDEDDENDEDQNTDDQDGDGTGGEDADTDDLGEFGCLDIVACKRYRCNGGINPDGSGDCSWYTVGDIPGGPYEQEWSVKNLPKPCRPKNHDFRELEALCNQAFPGDNCPQCCNNECGACTTVSLLGCN